jgi:hypothetical protein
MTDVENKPGRTMIKCVIEGCKYQTIDKSKMNRHLMYKHDIGVVLIHCEIDGCSYVCKSQEDMNRHLIRKHDIGGVLICCKIDRCSYTCKIKTEMDRHQQRIHDIGKFSCSFCAKACNSQNEYDDTQGSHTICRACYNKATGRNSRKEKYVCDYLNTLDFMAPFLLGMDKSFKSIGGCSKFRVDILYASGKHVLAVEVDEHSHMGNGNYTCEEKRISDMYDEFVGCQFTVIRFNPDAAKYPNGTRVKLSLEERTVRLGDLLKEIIGNLGNGDEPKIFVHYLFYNVDHPKLVQSIPKEMHW